MKTCKVCGEKFADKYGFCPLDGVPLTISLSQREMAFDPREFNLTLIGDARLTQRLSTELQFVLGQVKQAWPSFKDDPIAFTRAELGELGNQVKQTLARPHVLSGAMTAVLLICSLLLIVLVLERHSPKATNKAEREDPTRLFTIDLQSESAPVTTDKGVGAGERGRVGFRAGKGEGSNPVPARAQGGGSGGMNDPQLPSKGRPPIPSEIPAPIPTTYARLPQPSLPDAGLVIDPVLWRKLEMTSYGDPRSKSEPASNGPGNGGGVGTKSGTGIGDGDGPGFGRGTDGNMGEGPNKRGSGGIGGSEGNNPNPNENSDRVYSSPEVTQRARVLFKPEPQYTEEARKNDITGAVILRVVFSRTGEVTNISAIKTLPGGLTEKAIAAARQIRFVPATRNGQPVSMYMQLEYNFNLY